MNDLDLAAHLLGDARKLARQYRELAEKALAQVDDRGFLAELDDDANSLAVLVKHLGGNLRSRFRDFLSSDGEKPDRNRDAEFVIGAEDTRERLMALWSEGWGHLLGTLDALAPADLGKTVTVRGQPHTVVEALDRALAHAAYHAGQIVQLARHFRSGPWQSLSVPRGASEELNRRMREKYGGSPARRPEGLRGSRRSCRMRAVPLGRGFQWHVTVARICGKMPWQEVIPMPATKLNLPLSQATHAAIFSEARRRRLPATRLVRSIVEDWLAEQEKARVDEEIRRFARQYAGTEIDLSPALEEAAVAELRRLADDEEG